MLVLVADDEPYLLAVLAECLEDLGHTVRTAVDGQDALDQLRAGAFDLLVTDVVMPRLTGAELVTAVAAVAPGLQVIGDSGAEVLAVVQKPFEMATLAALVDRAAATCAKRHPPVVAA